MWELLQRTHIESSVRELLSEARVYYKKRGGVPVLQVRRCGSDAVRASALTRGLCRRGDTSGATLLEAPRLTEPFLMRALAAPPTPLGR